MAEKTSIIDQPITLSNQEDMSTKDKFGISRYEEALKRFIERADTPLTIALQGEWGSGKTSLMNLLKYHLCEVENAPYYPIWINTWQHSIMNNPEGAIVGILQSIIIQLGKASKDDMWDRIKPMLAKVGQFAGTEALNIVGRASGVGPVGHEVNKFLQDLDENGDSQIASLRKEIEKYIQRIISKEKSKSKGRKGFLFFIDDLDRIDPPVAVRILELLKNIFDLEHCIYVLAIDYDVVVKGLKPKFGELTDKNAREFRSFFDKIIQLPFAMPVSSYEIDSFLIDVLNRIGYLTPEEQKDIVLKNLSRMAKFSVGTNPRSLKRLTNILSLIQLMAECEGTPNDPQQTKDEVLIEKQVNFALVCLQIVYPLIYNTLLEFPNFLQWDNAVSNIDDVPLVKKLSLQDLSEEQEKKLQKQGDDFNDDWEKILFRICIKDSYLSSRVVDISRLLNMISSIIPKGEGNHNEEVAEIVERMISFSAVTNVHATEEPVGKKIEDYNPSWWLGQFRGKFEHKLNLLLNGLDSIKCTNKRVKGQLHFRFGKLPDPNPSGYAHIHMGHDDNLYHVIWRRGIKFLHGGFGSIQEEERLLGCFGLHDSVVADLKEYATKHPNISMKIDQDSYNEATPDGQRCGWLVLEVVSSSETLEGLVTDEAVAKFAVYINDLYRIRFKMTEEKYASPACHGYDSQLREQLKQMDIAPFNEMVQWYSQTYLKGCKVDGQTLGISFHLRSNGFRTLIWEIHQNKRIINEVMQAHPNFELYSQIIPKIVPNGTTLKSSHLILLLIG